MPDNNEIESFVTFTNNASMIKTDFFENLEECRLNCQYYKKCEAFIYYDDFRCYLFNLNQNISTFNKRLGAANSNRNYIYGFKTYILINKVHRATLDIAYFNKFENLSDNDCIRKCFLYEKCIAAAVSNGKCYIYKDLSETNGNAKKLMYDAASSLYITADEYEKLSENPVEIAKKSMLQLKDGSEKLSVNPMKQKSLKLGHYKLENSFKGIYSLTARQCWLQCDKDLDCKASSFNDNYHIANDQVSEIFNCFFYNTNYTAVANPEWISYLDITGYRILKSSEKPRLQVLKNLKYSNIENCIRACDHDKKCFASSYDIASTECFSYSNVAQFSQRTSIILDPKTTYLIKTGDKQFFRILKKR